MSLTLYTGSGSPYGWRVQLTLEHKGVSYAQRILSFSAGDLRDPAYLALNPRGRVPTLVDDGFVLFESVAIVEYLDQRFPEPPVIPRDPRAAAAVRRRVQEADAYFAVPMERLVEEVLTPDHSPSEGGVAAARAALVTELDRWERSVVPGGFLAGPEPTAADFALYPQLVLVLRIESRHPAVRARAAIGPALLGWKARMEELPAVQRTWPPHWGAWRP